MKSITFNSPYYRYNGVSDLLNELFKGEEKETNKRVSSNNPLVNVKDKDKEYELEFFVPGYKKEHFSISNVKNVLTVKAEVESKNEKADAHYTRREFSLVSFERSFELPEDVEGENIKASYLDGVLNVNIPKRELYVRDIAIEVPVV